jgi:hypothetical protein
MKIYGGGVGTNFFPTPMDVSAWDGISFWGRRGDVPGRELGKTLFFAVSDKYTDAYNGRVLFEDRQPFCHETTEDMSFRCDRFGVGVGLETDWRHYMIPFDRMRQRGYGRIAPELDLTAIIGLNIAFETGDWEFWLDDVAFYREVP